MPKWPVVAGTGRVSDGLVMSNSERRANGYADGGEVERPDARRGLPSGWRACVFGWEVLGEEARGVSG